MKTIHIFLIFLVVALAQLLVPGQMIMKREAILKDGVTYKFKTRPVDPNDPFRGKYITLQYDINTLKTEDTLWERKEKVYLYIVKDTQGFAVPIQISREKLGVEEDYVRADIIWYNKETREVNFDLPFDRFYMEESKAHDAEVIHREAQRDSLPDNTYAIVSIKKGSAVLKDVMIDGISIKEQVENNR